MTRFFTLPAFIATIPAANWLISNVGTHCIPEGPCLLPVGLGLNAPSGVLMVGAGLVLRDIVHEQFGAKVVIGAILLGAALSATFAAPTLAFASAAAFLLSELADMAVYAPLRKRRLILAVLLSGLVGSIVDSTVFLLLAFGSLDFVAGQVLGKFWMTLAVIPVLSVLVKNMKGSAA
ncbi:protein of unknown function DUF165 [Rhizobium phage RHph_X2_30]|nr:protein of unknown function DUF165 [Rhizobium phage RHph_X2_30]